MLATLSLEDERKLFTIAQAQDYNNAEKSLHYFIRAAWPLIEPGRPFIDNWHIRSICRHLEAVSRGEITRLIINIPPRSSKSTIVSVMWPVWLWLQDPSKRFLTGSHSAGIAIRDALKSRRLIDSKWFQDAWSDKFMLTSDQNSKQRYENDKTGYRITFSMGSGVTGEGGDVLLIDDPHDAKKIFMSDVERKSALDTYDQSLSTRLNDPDESAVVIIMQRLHEEDLTGHLLKKGGWEHLCFPMEYDPGRKCVTCLGVQDHREKEGELLCPVRFSPSWIEKMKRDMLGIYGTAGQFQQQPTPKSGGLINTDWFRKFSAKPSEDQWIEVVQFWDTAQKADELLNCPWVCGTWIRTATGYYLIDVYREWLTYPQGKRIAVSMAQRFNPNAVVIEDKSTGSSLLQELKKETTLSLIPFEPEGDKVTRLSVESPAIEAGNVWVPETAPWLPNFFLELANFPLSTTKDQADMLSMALKYFRTGGAKKAQVITDALGMLGW